MTVRSATKKRLIDRGVAEPHASLLALDRGIENVEAMQIDSIATVLSVSRRAAAEIHHSIHQTCPNLTLRSQFNDRLGRLHLCSIDRLADLSGDSNRFDAASLWKKHSGQPSPISFNDFSNDDEETTLGILQLLALEFKVSPSFASTFVFIIDGTDIVVTGIEIRTDILKNFANEMAVLNYISPADAEFLSLHADLMPPNKDRDLQKGNTVAHYGIKSTAKSMKYRARSCSSKSSNPSKDHPWPSSHWDKLGQITYCYSWDQLYDVMFDDGTTVRIHKDHIARLITNSGSNQGVSS